MPPSGFDTVQDYRVRSPDNWSFQPAFGFRLDIATGTTADVWGGAAAVRPLPLVPTAMSLVSSSASDNVATALGAQLAFVTFIDDTGDWRTSDLLLLAGLTPVPITYKPDQQRVTEGAVPSLPDDTSVAAPIYRVQDVTVVADAGATVAAPRVSNVGTLTVVDTATGTIVFEHVDPAHGRSHSSAFHVPRAYVGYLTRVIAGTSRGAGTIELAVTNGPGTAFLRLELAGLSSSTVVFASDSATAPTAAESDMQILVTAGSNNIDVSAIMQIRLRPFT